MFSYAENCLVKCCIDHGLPYECVTEEDETIEVSHYNQTHKSVKLVQSENCFKYRNTMNKCKEQCTGTCTKKCCNNNGIPIDCLDQESKNEEILHYNQTHKLIKIVHRNECFEYTSILNDCRSDCGMLKLDDKSDIKPTNSFEVGE